MIQYRKFENGKRGSIIVLGPSGVLQADSFHPHWHAIVAAAESGDSRVYDLFDVKAGLGRRLESLSDRVGYNGENITFDGNPVHSVLANQIKRALESGEADYMPLIRFWEKLESNPNEHSKKQAYNWLATHDFKVTESGDVVAYKGVSTGQSYKARVQDISGEGQTFWSISASHEADAPSGYVDGNPIAPLCRIPQKIGSVVTMPRDEVKHDPNVHCHRGLHVGDWSYASGFAQGAVLEVHVNPRDIVSVPNDNSCRKVRTCKYTVVSVVTAQYSGGPVLRPAAVAETWEDVGYKGY